MSFGARRSLLASLFLAAAVAVFRVPCAAPATTPPAGTTADDDSFWYEEELYVQPLDDDMMLSVFNFALRAHPGTDATLGLHRVGDGFPRPYARLFEHAQHHGGEVSGLFTGNR